MILSGDLKDMLKFYQKIEEQSGSGFKKESTKFIFKQKAEKLKTQENLVTNADEIFHENILNFRCRYRKEVDETWIIEYKNDFYNILSLETFVSQGEMKIRISKINK